MNPNTIAKLKKIIEFKNKGLLNFKSAWRRIRLEISTWILLIFLLFTTYIIFILLIPSFIYKKCVLLMARCFRRDLTHVMQSGNAFFALENITERAKMNIVVCLVLDGRILDKQKLEDLGSFFTSRVLEKRRDGAEKQGSKVSDLVYPELRQIWTSFMGYFFWKNESNFQIGEHIRICDYKWNDGFKMPEVCTQKDLKQLATRLVSESWKTDFSPWEFLIVPRYKMDKNNYEFEKDVGFEMLAKGDEKTEEKSIVILRFHHAMGDGKAWLNILMDDLGQSKEAQLPQEKLSQSRQKLNFWRALFLPFKLPYDLAKNTVESFDKANDWHTRGKRSKKYYTAVTSSFPSQFIKDLKNKFGVSYSAVLMCAVTGGIRRVMKEAGQKVPREMAGYMILPLPNHPEGLTIHAAALNFVWPIKTENSIIRFKEIFRDMKSKKKSHYPMALHLFQNVLGIFPNFVRRGIYSKGMSTTGATLFPGPATPPQILNFSVVDSLFFIGIFAGQVGALITTVVMGGRQRLVVTLDKTLFPSQEQFDKLGGFIEEELIKLKNTSHESFMKHANSPEIV